MEENDVLKTGFVRHISIEGNKIRYVYIKYEPEEMIEEGTQPPRRERIPTRQGSERGNARKLLNKYGIKSKKELKIFLLKYHPDKNQGANSEMVAEVSAAYDLLYKSNHHK